MSVYVLSAIDRNVLISQEVRLGVGAMTKHQKLWAAARRKFIKDNPEALCAIRYPGCYYFASDVDHIIKRSVAPELRYVQSNLQWACRWCHNIKDNT